MNIGFKIINRVTILYASKFLLILIGYYKEDIIVFFYLFDLFEDLFIILLGCNSFQYNSIADFIKAKMKVNKKSI